LFTTLEILTRILDSSLPPFIVAEMSGNHGGSLDKALELVFAAKSSGADALKLQTYRPETITVNAKEERFLLKSGLWKGRYLHQLYEDAMTPWEWHPIIAEKASQLGMVCFSSAFDETAVDFLEESIDPPLHKIASFELNHFPLLNKIGETKKPVLASTGVSNASEIRNAIHVLKKSGCPQVILLHCVSEYPAKPQDFCLQLMPKLQDDYQVPFGLSDHSLGHLVAVAATALGARVIEKHISLDRDKTSIDGGFSMLPLEFSEMVSAVHSTHLSITGEKTPDHPRGFKRSILVSSSICAGDRFTNKNLRIARPGDGMCPSRWQEILKNGYAKKNLSVGHPLSDEDILFP